MSEQLRSQLPVPDLYTKMVEIAPKNQALPEQLVKEAESKLNPATVDHEVIAYDVAHAIKPEIDKVSELRAEEAAHDPISGAAIMGNQGLTGIVPFPKSRELKASEADLERNSRYATELSMKQHLGGSALEIAMSRQKMANIKLRKTA